MAPEIEYILSLQAVRERAHAVLSIAKTGGLKHFDFDKDKLSDAADYVIDIIKRDFGPSNYHLIPPHGRWQHFEVGNVPRIDRLLAHWDNQGYSATEKARSLVDLFFVSVLLDAGAGDVWKFHESSSDAFYSRSEGIAIASYHMFLGGDFASSSSPRKDIVDGRGLQALDTATLNRGFQVSESNPMIGVESRCQLLVKLGDSLVKLPEIFGADGRPGNLVDYLLSKASGSKSLDYSLLWSVLQNVLLPIWPSDRTQINGIPVGDAWPLQVLADHAKKNGDTSPTASIQPFHKLTQWLAYSLMVPFERILGVTWQNAHLGTGLPEYRNGGLFVDTGVLKLKPELDIPAPGEALPKFGSTDDVIVEWRAMTVALLDELHKVILERMGIQLSLAQVLESGSWKAGRELAAERRPKTRSSPILLAGDGTLF